MNQLSQSSNFYHWILNHDNSYWFIFLYVGLAIYLSIAVGLFWLAVVVGIHFMLEWIRQSHFHTEPIGVFLRVCWELKLDFILIIFAFLLEVYMGVILGIVGVGASARAAAQIGSRFVAWENTLKGILISLDDLAIVSKGMLSKANNNKLAKSAKNNLVPPSGFHQYGGWFGKWSVGDKVFFVFATVVAILLILAPAFTTYSIHGILYLFLEVFHPWPA